MSQTRKQQKTHTLYTYRSAWTARGASTSLQAIADPLGAPIFDPRAGAKELARHWGQIHRAAGADPAAMCELLSDAPQIPGNIQWRLEEE
eukprot:7695677-Pyramimonas_sp.AAC.1